MKRIASLLIAVAACLSAAPAGVAGKWQLTAKDPYDVTIKAELVLQQNGKEWSGSVQGPDGSIPLRNVSFKDSTLVCTLTYEDAEVTMTMKLEGDDVLKGTYEADAGPSGPVEAFRIKQTSAIGGVWKITTVGPDGEALDTQVTLAQTAGAWSGNISVESYNLDLPLDNVKVDGSAVSFQVSTEAGVYALNARLNGDKLEGTILNPEGAKNHITGTR